MANHPAGKRPAQAAEYIGVSRWKLYQLIEHDPDFPRPIKLSKRCVIIPTEQLDTYLAKKQAKEAQL